MKQFAWAAAAVAALGLAAQLGTAAPAQAQRRPDTRTMTCDQARALVWQNGAVVLTTGRYTYDRFVSGERYCSTSEMTRRAYAPTRDAQSCHIGYICVVDTRREDDWWWLHRR